MKAAILLYSKQTIIQSAGDPDVYGGNADVVICFGAKSDLSVSETYEMLREKFVSAEIITCSTAGNIFGVTVTDENMSVMAIKFSEGSVITHAVVLGHYPSTLDAGKALAEKFASENLTSLLLFSDGTFVNGSELAGAFRSEQYPVSGGLAGDGSHFLSTLAGLNGNAQEGLIVGVGLQGSKLRIGHGTCGGWEQFGLERTITASTGNELFEIDNKSALDLYKRYLGNCADELPASALLFPLAVKLSETDEVVVRTILSINEERRSMTFAGDVPVGAKVRFMKGNFDKITNAAAEAARQTTSASRKPALALLVSCVGRREILRSRTEEELEAVQEVLGTDTLLAGFYSYGELSPVSGGASCQLHNQTMTITTFSEDE